MRLPFMVAFLLVSAGSALAQTIAPSPSHVQQGQAVSIVVTGMPSCTAGQSMAVFDDKTSIQATLVVSGRDGNMRAESHAQGRKAGQG